MRQNEACHAIGQGRLADAGRAAQDPGVRHAAGAIGVEQRLLGLAVAEECGGLARMERRVALLVFAAAHDRALSMITGADAGWSRRLTSAQMASLTGSALTRASMSTQRSGSRSASSR